MSTSLSDLINASFELLGGVTQILNIRQLIRDKEVKGVSWAVTAFFMTWGLWNLYFYPHLHQYVSTVGGALIVITNGIWLALVLKYKTQKKPFDEPG